MNIKSLLKQISDKIRRDGVPEKYEDEHHALIGMLKENGFLILPMGIAGQIATDKNLPTWKGSEDLFRQAMELVKIHDPARFNDFSLLQDQPVWKTCAWLEASYPLRTGTWWHRPPSELPSDLMHYFRS